MFDGFKESPGTPLKRAESGTLLIGKEVFIFGGCNLDVRFGDFWKFDLESKTWGLITTEKSPGVLTFHILIDTILYYLSSSSLRNSVIRRHSRYHS